MRRRKYEAKPVIDVRAGIRVFEWDVPRIANGRQGRDDSFGNRVRLRAG